jgi:hypothetical protein
MDSLVLGDFIEADLYTRSCLKKNSDIFKNQFYGSEQQISITLIWFMPNLFYYVVRFANVVRIFQISYILDSCLPNDASYHEEDDFFQNNPHKSL